MYVDLETIQVLTGMGIGVCVICAMLLKIFWFTKSRK
jgi:hypothetical protein